MQLVANDFIINSVNMCFHIYLMVFSAHNFIHREECHDITYFYTNNELASLLLVWEVSISNLIPNFGFPGRFPWFF
jgi:hypothetical protein